MRIQNNIMALNTHRQYTTNNDKVSASAEKLSSGFRINRAADDAAGLAISEKMRSQIRGLNMSARNSQDAASLIQTAEGALQEVHSMLQRMNELADQSATGTNATFDRTQIAKEFDQLKREINDIAEQTTFNNMKILDGSLSAQGFTRSAATVGLYANDMGTLDAGNAVIKSTPSIATGVGNAAVAQAGTIVNTAAIAASSGTVKGDVYQAQITFDDGTVIKGAELAAVANNDVTIAATDVGKSFNGVQFTSKDGTKYAIAATNASIVFTAVETGKVSTPITKADVSINFVRNNLDATATDQVDAGDNAGAAAIAVTSAATGTAGKRVNTVEVDVNKLNVGDTITVGDMTYELVSNLGDTKTGNTGILFTTDKTTSNLASKMTLSSGVTVASAAEGTFTITQTTLDSDKSVAFSHKSGATQGTQVEFDLVKMKDGDEMSVKVGTTEYTATYRQGDTVTDIYNNMGLRSAFGDDAYVKDNSIILNERKASVDFTGVTPGASEFGQMRIQVGALEGEQLNIEVKSMNTAGLGLDSTNIYDQDSAGKAITAVRTAIDTVSDQRALLGAMQNRMTYKINNLKISAENLSAAESRIRDVDIASEMTTFTKNNILGQAATAMLAQANSAPQNVLSLLR